MKLFKIIVASIGCTFMVITFAQRTPVNLEEGTSYMQIALQKEIYDILISDTNEIQAIYREDKSSYKNDSLIPYEKILKEICSRDNSETCPEIYYCP